MILTPTPADVPGAIKAAQAGDVIQLPAGFSKLVISKVVNAGEPIVIEGGADLAGCMIADSEGFTIRGAAFGAEKDASLTRARYGLQILRSSRITVDGCRFAAPVELQEFARGLQLRESSRIVVAGCVFERLRYGVGTQDVSRVQVANCRFASIFGDAIRGWVNSQHITISGNDFTDIIIPAAGDHIDAIQFWTVGATKPTTDVLIEGNVYVRGEGDPAQGIFVGNERMIPFERVTIRGNAVVGSTWNGIWLVGGKDVVIEDNLVLPMAWAERHVAEYGHIAPRIVVKSIEGGAVRGNVARIASDPKTPLPPIEGNTEPAAAAFGDLAALKAWQARRGDPRDVRIAELEASLAAAHAVIAAVRAALS